MQALGLGIPDDGKQVAADAVAHGLHEAQHGIGGNRGVHGIAPGLEHIQRHLRGQGLAGGRHALGGEHLGPAGKGFAGDAVTTVDSQAGHDHGGREDDRIRDFHRPEPIDGTPGGQRVPNRACTRL